MMMFEEIANQTRPKSKFRTNNNTRNEKEYVLLVKKRQLIITRDSKEKLVPKCCSEIIARVLSL